MISGLYAQQRDQILEAVLAPGVRGDEPVDACPGWSVHDLVAHLVGLADDWLTGNLEVYASSEWTDRQVEAFGGLTLQELADAWHERADRFGAFLDNPSSADHLPEKILTVVGEFPVSTFPAGILIDATQHAADICSALEVDPTPGEPALAFCNKVLSRSTSYVWSKNGLPPIHFAATESGQELWIGDPDNTVLDLNCSSFELFRCFGGRRTREQMVALDWRGDRVAIDSVVEHLVSPFFKLPVAVVDEPATT